MRRREDVMILEPGNLLGMARLNFRWKCNNQFWGIRSPEMLSAFVSGHFLWNDRLFRRIIQIKWQAILLRMKPFPPRIYERIIFYPGVASLPLKLRWFRSRICGIFFTLFQSMLEESFPQFPANCDVHLAEKLFQTLSGRILFLYAGFFFSIWFLGITK